MVGAIQSTEATELLALLKAKNCDVTPDFTGALIRGGHNNRFWFVGNRHVTESGAVHHFANFGDWRTGEEWTWESDIPLDAAEASALRAAMDGQKKKIREDRERLNDETAAQAEVFVTNDCVYKGFSPYLEKKGFAPGELFGAGISTKFDSTLTVVPYRDVSGKVWGYQTIDDNGEKRFLAGAKIQGNFFQMGEMTEEGYICEGFATGAAIRLASSKVVFVAFNSGNLLAVSKAIRKAHPSMRLYIVADNDRKTLTPLQNPGVHFAAEVFKAGYVQGIIIPTGIEGTDANDLFVEKGLASVTTLLTEGRTTDLVKVRTDFLTPPTSPGAVARDAGGGDLDTAPRPKTEKVKKLSEVFLANTVLEMLGGRCLTQDEDLWLWVGTHWVHADAAQVNRVKNIFTSIDPEMGSGAVDSAYRTLLRVAPQAPRNMFEPFSHLVSFQDGMLTLVERADGESSLQLGPHDPESYCTTYIDVKWNTSPDTRNSLFDEALSSAFEGDPFKEEKILALKEFAGAMLLPAFPRVTFLFGLPGSNKSTIAMALLHLLPANVKSTVDPGEMEGFMKEATINKLVNYNLDINEHKPFPMPLVKRLLDRMPETINRKNKKAVSALPPGIHLYAANMMPPNFERSVGPLARRITIIQFPRHVSVNQDGSVKAWVRKDYWRTIVGLTQTDSEKARLQEGILNFMKEGLARLVAQHGMFTHIESSQRALETWHKDSNAVLQFLEDIDQGEAHKDGVKVIRREGMRISRVAFYEAFQSWCGAAGIPDGRISRAKFYQALQGAGIEEAKSNGERLVVGFGVGSTANSVA